MLFDYNISGASIALFSISLLCLIYIIVFYGGAMRRVRRHYRKCNVDSAGFALELPKASVVLYTHNEDLKLGESLPHILEQNYPGQFEVIVVNDGTANESDILVTQLKSKYKNLYLTFAPDNSRNVSRKKLAITLGVKAAKGEIIVLTDANTLVPSSKWLQQMVMPFANPATEVVIGFNRINVPRHRWSGRLLTIFDYTADTIAWLSSAIKGSPYRACGNNVAYRKQTFFNNKGFSNSLNLRNGEDDIFINEISNAGNTVVQLSDITIGTAGNSQRVRKEFRQYRRDHAFTGRSLPKASRRLMAAGEWLMWVLAATALGGAYLAGITNLFGWAVAAVLIIAMMVIVIVMWRKTVLCLSGYRMMLTLPFMAATRPLRNIKTSLLSGARNNQCYTWQ